MAKRDYHHWSKDKLIHEIETLKKRKKFGLVWEDSEEDVAIKCEDFLPVLSEAKKKKIQNDKSDLQHIMIEGDNYHALTTLCYTHKKKVDVIYIDPPYNTGNKSWIYNNHYVEKDDRFKHSKWLSFMDKRLRLAKILLSKKGFFICSIDDNEQAYLGILLDEIFTDYKKSLIVIKHHGQGSGGATVSRVHEYAYILTKSDRGFFKLRKPKKNEAWSLTRTGQGENNYRYGRPNQFFAILVDNKHRVIDVEDAIPEKKTSYPKDKTPEGLKRIYPISKNGIERCWIYNAETMRDKIKQGLVTCTKNYTLKLLKKDLIKSPIFSIWDDATYNAGTGGTNLLKDMSISFDYPKSLMTIKDLIEIELRHNRNAVVLDFFSGSGTTGHAVLELNKEDGGNRQFILCTNNENNNNNSGGGVAEGVCYPRLKKVMDGYTNLKKQKIGGLGGNLQYYKTDFVDQVRTDSGKRKLVNKSTEMLCLTENTFNKVLEEKNSYAVFENSKRMTGIIYDEDAIDEFNEAVKKLQKPLIVYVFSYDHTYNKEDFANIKNLVEVKPIPEVILNVYRKVYKSIRKSKHKHL